MTGTHRLETPKSSVVEVPATSAELAQPRVSPARVAFASAVGTAIEWYDFFIFNTAAALVFGALFFPTVSPTAGTLAAFATFGVAFVARPVGGVVFGHFGDRLGRKKMLVLSLLIMGVSTFAVGLLPTFDAVGVWAPVLLVTLRFLQGFAVGGEWGGAVLMAAEHAPKSKRGFYASWPQAGVPAGLVLASVAFIVLGRTLSDEQFLAWGWRVPFLISAVLVLIGMYIRFRVVESPAFQAVQEGDDTAKMPVVDVLRTERRSLLLGMGALFASGVPFYVATVLSLTYVTERTGLSRETVLFCLLGAAALQVFTMPAASLLSDRVGRRPVLITGAVLGIVLAFPFFWLLDTGSVPLVFLALVLAVSVVHALTYGPVAGFVAELFPTRLRYTGSSISFQFGAMLASAPTPFVAAALLAWAGGPWAISLYIIVAALVAIVAIKAAPETFRQETDASPERPTGRVTLR
jgi:metabolite-proton symporter